MKLLSAALDLALVPFAMAADVITCVPRIMGCDDGKSYTRQQIEAVEKDLEL
jgi:hypothetical protein